MCYYEGYGVDVDYNKAVELFQKAIESDDPNAYYNLARCYFYGRGVEQNVDKAKELAMKAKELIPDLEDEEGILSNS